MTEREELPPFYESLVESIRNSGGPLTTHRLSKLADSSEDLTASALVRLAAAGIVREVMEGWCVVT